MGIGVSETGLGGRGGSCPLNLAQEAETGSSEQAGSWDNLTAKLWVWLKEAALKNKVKSGLRDDSEINFVPLHTHTCTRISSHICEHVCTHTTHTHTEHPWHVFLHICEHTCTHHTHIHTHAHKDLNEFTMYHRKSFFQSPSRASKGLGWWLCVNLTTEVNLFFVKCSVLMENQGNRYGNRL